MEISDVKLQFEISEQYEQESKGKSRKEYEQES